MLERNSDLDPFSFDNIELRPVKYENYNVRSIYVPMRDGVKIALDIYLPETTQKDVVFPTVLMQTRYWRDMELRSPFNKFIKSLSKKNVVPPFTSRGFAVINGDVRGTGASFGHRISPWSYDEIMDDKDIVDWIISQPWSDGNVLTLGNSYSGTTAELVAVVSHPAVKGIIPMHNELDPYLDIAFPGGIFNDWFVKTWSKFNNDLDANNTKGLGILASLALKGIKPTDEDLDQELLVQAIKDHELNIDVYENALKLTYRDDSWDEKGNTIKNFSVYKYQEEIQDSYLPIYYWGSWMDGATSNVVINSFLTFSNPFIGIIGAWSHGAIYHASPFKSGKNQPNPDYDTQYKAWMQFFDGCLQNKIPNEKLIYYYTMGEEKWKKTSIWPPDGIVWEEWYFSEDNHLSFKPPMETSGQDDYKINYSASTGKKNRWYTQMGGDPVVYSNRRSADKKLLTYTSDPLKHDIEITGHPIVSLYLSLSGEDGALIIYLEDVDEKGKIRYITEGHMRLLHRKLSPDIPPYKTLVPYHSFERKDGMSMSPGVTEEITFGLLPTSVLIRKGHRIRVAIAGADKDTFERIPKQGTPTISMKRNTIQSSRITLPSIAKN